MKKGTKVLAAMMLVSSLLMGCGSANTATTAAPAAETTAASQGEQTTAAAQGEQTTAAKTTEEPEKAAGKTYKVAMIYQDLSGQFNIYFQGQLQKKCAELGVTLVEFDGQGETDKQLSQCENALQQGVDALMFIPVDKSGCAPIIENCNTAGIPVICCNNPTDNVEDATAYVGANDVDAGIMEMEFMAELIGGKGNICIVEGPFGHSAQIARQEGIKQILEKYPDIQVLFSDTANWDRTEAMDLMENWIQKSGDSINAVVCHSDDMGMGVLQAIQGAGLDDQIQVIGIDAIFDALNAVKNGEMAATVFQDVYGQADGAIEVALKILNGESYEKTTYVPFQLVTKDNVDSYLANFK